MVRRLGIVARLDRLEALRCAHRVALEASESGLQPILEYHTMLAMREYGLPVEGYETVFVNALGRLADIIVSIGGDGTMLKLAHFLDHGVRLAGIRYGRRGFLTRLECSDDDLHALFSDRVEWIRAPRLCVNLAYAPPALNEVAISAPRGKIVSLDIQVVCDERVWDTRIVGDGVIISTPLGSFAYSFSAGGPLLACDECLVVTPLSPLSHAAPLVVQSQCVVHVHIGESYRAPWLIIDGQYTTTLPVGYAVSINTCGVLYIATRKDIKESTG